MVGVKKCDIHMKWSDYSNRKWHKTTYFKKCISKAQSPLNGKKPEIVVY